MLSAQLLLAAAVGLVLGGIVTFFMLRRRERVRRELEKHHWPNRWPALWGEILYASV